MAKIIHGFKFITSDMKSKNGNLKWELGKWVKREGKIELWIEGFHACKTALQSLEYVYGDKWFIVEARGKLKEEKNNKFVSSEMRLIKEIPIDRVVKLFAIRCAKRCLKNYESKYPNDKRVFEAIEGAELYLDGKIDIHELNKWGSAAWSAESAARSAARSARSAESAAWSAAWSAPRSAESAEKKWQEKELNKIIKEVLRGK